MKKNLAKRFAKSLIAIEQEEKRYKETGAELRNIAAAFVANPEIKRFLLNPMYKIEDRQALANRVAESLNISPSVKQFLSVLIVARAVALIEDISAAYDRMEDKLAGRMAVTVETAISLEEGRIAEIKKKLEQIIKKEIILSVKKNPALIGGLVFRVGNTILDGSVKTQLEKVRERIMAGSMQ